MVTKDVCPKWYSMINNSCCKWRRTTKQNITSMALPHHHVWNGSSRAKPLHTAGAILLLFLPLPRNFGTKICRYVFHGHLWRLPGTGRLRYHAVDLSTTLTMRYLAPIESTAGSSMWYNAREYSTLSTLVPSANFRCLEFVEVVLPKTYFIVVFVDNSNEGVITEPYYRYYLLVEVCMLKPTLRWNKLYSPFIIPVLWSF